MSESEWSAWSNFFGVTGSVAGAVMALVFVAMQVRFKEIFETTFFRKTSAAFSVYELAAPMFVSLIALIPPHKWWWGCWAVGAVGGAFILTIFVSAGRERFGSTPSPVSWDWLDTWEALGPIISVASFGGLMTAAYFTNLTWAAILCVWLIFSGLSESVVLLTGRK